MTKDGNGPVKVVDRRWWVNRESGEETSTTQVEERSLKPAYVEELEARLLQKDRELQDVVARYRDATREFEDSRARLRQEIGREIERARRSMLVELLETVDNLDRAIEAARQASAPEALLSGVELVRRQFLARLEKWGVRRVDPLGTPFDPSIHEAVTTVPTDDPSRDGIVAGVIVPGYKVGDDVLRPAMVAVARYEPKNA